MKMHGMMMMMRVKNGAKKGELLDGTSKKLSMKIIGRSEETQSFLGKKRILKGKKLRKKENSGTRNLDSRDRMK